MQCCGKAILSEQAKADILNHSSIGNDMHKKFKDERIYSETCIWDKIPQRKLFTFKSTLKTIKTKFERKLITMKEDRSLMQRILVTSQKQYEIDLSMYIRKYEFSVSPRSLFSFDGEVHGVLQTKNVTNLDPFTDLYVVLPDTDVLLLLIYYYPQLCASTTFRAGSGNDQRDIEIRKMYESIGPLHAKAILGFHVFTGCDQIGRFNGK